MAPTKVFLCKCSNSYQDSVYGKGNRLHNGMQLQDLKPDATKKWRCTVCGNVRSE